MRINNIKSYRSIYYLMLLAFVVLFNQCKEPASLNALIVSDTPGVVSDDLQKILENTGLFDADISKGKSPNFSKYDVVLLNLASAEWSDEVKESFIKYVNGGGGVVAIGSSAYAFGEWPELNEIVGVTSTQPQEKSKEAFEFRLVNSKDKNPILEGLETSWIHKADFLSFNTYTLSGEVDVLATAWADTLQGGSGAQLPVLFTLNYGEGRIFHSTLGMAASAENLAPIQCVGFITTLQRGAEWAATGVVSQEVPIDFPNSASTHAWSDYKPLTLDEILSKSMSYEMGKSKKYLTDFSMRIRNCDGKAESYARYEDKILDFLNSDATIDSKKYMCRELSWMGSDKAISVLEKLINDKDLSESASYALQRLRM